MKITAAGKTDTGLVREKNEDAFLIAEHNNLFLVADGLGGHSSGEVASSMAVDCVARSIEKDFGLSGTESGLDQKYLSILDTIFQETNSHVYQASKDNPEYRGMGTTLIAAWILDTKCYLCHVGDVRGYCYRDGGLRQITRDHSVVADLIQKGEIREEEARFHPMRNRLLKAVGTKKELAPETSLLELENKDRILLCSDGLWGMISDSEISDVLNHTTATDEACQLLIDKALDAGGKDNITAVLIDIDNDAKVSDTKWYLKLFKK